MRHIVRIAASSFLVLCGVGSALGGCGSPSSDNLFGGATGVTTGAVGTTSVGAGNGATSSAAATTGSGVGGATPSPSSTTTSNSNAPMSSSAAASGDGQGGAASASASVTASSSTGLPLAEIGCSDGTREAYVDPMKEPNIAGCAGAFLVPGVVTPMSSAPQCNRQSGNDGVNQTGMGCSIADLCAEGWHVCAGAAEVASSASTGQCDPPVVGAVEVFWLTRQVEDENGNCVQLPNMNNVTGCGTFGSPLIAAQMPTCSPLTHFMRAVDCGPSATWFCGNQQPAPAQTILDESAIVYHQGNTEGGVLCCKG